MSTLHQRSADYLAIRRSLGYKLAGHGAELSKFIGWLDKAGASVITADLALAWAQSRPISSPVRERQRLAVARRFAEYVSAIDPRTEVPAKDLLPAQQQRTAPYIYSPAEISALMAAARSLTPPLKAATYETFIGLLACTGLRFGEAAGLDRVDVDLTAGDLLVRFGKNGRSRHVPIHSSTVAALARYGAQRDDLCRGPPRRASSSRPEADASPTAPLRACSRDCATRPAWTPAVTAVGPGSRLCRPPRYADLARRPQLRAGEPPQDVGIITGSPGRRGECRVAGNDRL